MSLPMYDLAASCCSNRKQTVHYNTDSCVYLGTCIFVDGKNA